MDCHGRGGPGPRFWDLGPGCPGAHLHAQDGVGQPFILPTVFGVKPVPILFGLTLRDCSMQQTADPRSFVG